MVIHVNWIMIFLFITACRWWTLSFPVVVCFWTNMMTCHWYHHSNCLVGSMWGVTLIQKILISYVSRNFTIQTQTLKSVPADFIANFTLFDLSCLPLVTDLLAAQFRSKPVINKEIAWNHGTYKYMRYTNLFVVSFFNTGINNCLR
jgi:hypothetical protein